jgi:hypothetical protein
MDQEVFAMKQPSPMAFIETKTYTCKKVKLSLYQAMEAHRVVRC